MEAFQHHCQIAILACRRTLVLLQESHSTGQPFSLPWSQSPAKSGNVWANHVVALTNSSLYAVTGVPTCKDTGTYFSWLCAWSKIAVCYFASCTCAWMVSMCVAKSLKPSKFLNVFLIRCVLFLCFSFPQSFIQRLQNKNPNNSPEALPRWLLSGKSCYKKDFARTTCGIQSRL